MRAGIVLFAVLTLAPAAVRAQGVGRNEISVGAGVQLDVTGWEPAGMKLFFEYARRLGPHGAIVFQANPLVLPGVYGERPCHDRIAPCAAGFSGNGYSFDMLFGGKWRWRAGRSPVLGTFDLTFGAVPLWARLHDDNGVAVVGRVGGGVAIFLAAHFALRFDAHMLAGPAFLGYWRCDGCGDIHPYIAFDTGMAAEFVF
jgi:hypothetical protein